jgi:DNA-binding XRE family transcriptional regulator
MKIIANNYKNNEVFKIIREWTGLTQTELAKELGRKSRDGITKIETGENDFYFDTLMKIIKKHNMIMTIEKK